ncbi:AAA family ATPase [Actinoplanes sp. NPDC051343]|uniref:AAA family ATPase n=1 Tax=Actinoplanes sp. NPDC051343 TaxID=3363906 RepID=UPI00378E257E
MAGRGQETGHGVELLGRGPERSALDTLLAALRAGESRVLVLHGPAGVGKTALLDHTAATATGLGLLRTTGLAAETELSYAALHRLCAPLFDRLPKLPPPQRTALETVFGTRDGRPPERFLVALAVLGLLSDASAEGPLLCLVDDAQWLDRPSAQVLGFVGRRLLAESVGLVMAARDRAPDLRGLPELEIAGLPEADAQALLRSVTHGPFDPHVLDRIVAETRGNPLALRDFPNGLPVPRLAGGFALLSADSPDDPALRERIAALPGPARLLLLVAAAEPVGDPALVWRAAEQLGVTPASALGAGIEGLLAIDVRVTFAHPLVRLSAYRSAPDEDRRRAHRVLARLTDQRTDPDRRAWHLAAAAPAPDESVALALEQATGRARDRGGLAAAAAFRQRAVALTADPARRATRAATAADVSLRAGDLEAARSLAGVAARDAEDDLVRAKAQLVRARLALLDSAHPARPGTTHPAPAGAHPTRPAGAPPARPGTAHPTPPDAAGIAPLDPAGPGPADRSSLDPAGPGTLGPADRANLGPVGRDNLGPVGRDNLGPAGPAGLGPAADNGLNRVDRDGLGRVDGAGVAPADRVGLGPAAEAGVGRVDGGGLGPVAGAGVGRVDGGGLGPVAGAGVGWVDGGGVGRFDGAGLGRVGGGGPGSAYAGRLEPVDVADQALSAMLAAARQLEPFDLDLAREAYLLAWGAAARAARNLAEVSGPPPPPPPPPPPHRPAHDPPAHDPPAGHAAARHGAGQHPSAHGPPAGHPAGQHPAGHHPVGRARTASRLAAVSRSVPPPAGEPGLLDLILTGYARLVTDGPGEAIPLLTRAAAALATRPIPARWGWLAGGVGAALWDDDAMRDTLGRAADAARAAGALTELPRSLVPLAVVTAWNGEFDAAEAIAAEAARVGKAIGMPVEPDARLFLAALRGDGAAAPGAVGHWTAAVLGNGLARYEQALGAARAAAASADPWISAWALPELVEAAARTGDAELAGAALTDLVEATELCDSDWATGVVARCRALVSDGPAARSLYAEAIERLGRTRLRPELARAHLLYGEWLRRRRQRVDARVQLRTAYEISSAIGMAGFADRARRELLATGETARRRTPEAATDGELTAQERQIALLVRDGLSNPEVGSRLFLSPRTVEWHLRKVFAKLGIGSRRQLREALQP